MRHERAMILILAYVIGFTSAFIAYGVQDNKAKPVSYAQAENTAGIVTASPEPLITQDDVLLDDHGLFVIKNDRKEVVSAQLPSGVEPGTGYHVSVDKLALTNDGRLLYYCAQETFEDPSCKSYVYSVLTHTVRPE